MPKLTDKQFRWVFCIVYALLGAALTPMDTLGVILLVVGIVAAYVFACNFPIYVRRRHRELSTVLHPYDG